MDVIEAEALTKTFRFHRKAPGLRGSIASLFRRERFEKTAVSDITFRIGSGEIVGFLGPNGAGKTTTLKMLCGLLHPTAGSARVLGHTPSRREPSFLRSIALVMGQRTMLNWDIPAADTLLLQKEMYDLRPSDFRASLDELSSMLEVTHLLNVQVRKLSLGERMKMELLAALVHRPQVVFLDEPTIGLDVVSQQRVRDFLLDLNRQRGTTLLLTSHYMDDIEALCPRVLLIHHGTLRFDGSLTSLVARSAPHKRVRAVYESRVLDTRAASLLSGLEYSLSEDRHTILVDVPRSAVADAAGRLLPVGTIVDLSIEESPIEDIIRAIFRSEPTPEPVL